MGYFKSPCTLVETPSTKNVKAKAEMTKGDLNMEDTIQ